MFVPKPSKDLFWVFDPREIDAMTWVRAQRTVQTQSCAQREVSASDS